MAGLNLLSPELQMGQYASSCTLAIAEPRFGMHDLVGMSLLVTQFSTRLGHASGCDLLSVLTGTLSR